MAKVIAQRELRNDSGKVLAAVAAGETFVVTRNGAPVAELRPVAAGRRTRVPRAELLAALSSSRPLDRDAWRAELDAIVDPSL